MHKKISIYSLKWFLHVYKNNTTAAVAASFIHYCYFSRKSLNLVETLLTLAEAGQYENVKNVFIFPFKNCPDILVFGLLQTKVGNDSFTISRQLMFTCLSH